MIAIPFPFSLPILSAAVWQVFLLRSLALLTMLPERLLPFRVCWPPLHSMSPWVWCWHWFLLFWEAVLPACWAAGSSADPLTVLSAVLPLMQQELLPKHRRHKTHHYLIIPLSIYPFFITRPLQEQRPCYSAYARCIMNRRYFLYRKKESFAAS